MTSAIPLLAGPARALEWADRHTKAIERTTMVSLVLGIVLYCTYATTGLNGLVAAGGSVAVIAASIVGYRFAPQLTGTLASTIGFIAALMIVATSLNPLWAFVGVQDYALIYPVVFAAIAAVSWLMPSTGVHRGWTTFVGQAAVALSVPVAVLLGTSQWRGMAIAAGTAIGLLVVGLRIRHVPKGRRGGKKSSFVRGFGMGTVIVLLGLVFAIGNTSNAGAWGLGDKVGETLDDAVCSITRPDMSAEVVGTGPESLIPNFNFAQAKRINPSDEDARGYPQYADVAQVFEPGSDNSLSPRYTLYEISGLRGIKWINWQWNGNWEEQCSTAAWLSATIGNFILKGSSYLLQGTIAFKEYSQVANPLEVLYSKANPIVDSMFVNFFTPAAGVMFLLVGISMAVKSVKNGGFREAVSEAGGALLVCFIAGFAYGGLAASSFQNPNANGFYTVGSTLDELGGQLNAAVAELFFSAIESTQGTMCVRPEGGDDSLSPNAPGQRITSCLLAETLAYKPWAVGQFGAAGMNEIPTDGATAPTDPRPGSGAEIQAEEGKLPCYNGYKGCEDMRSYVIAQIGGPDITARYSKCMEAHNATDDPWGASRHCDPYNAIAKQLYDRMEAGSGDQRAQEAASMMNAYKGGGFMPHLSQAVTALVGVITVGIGLSVMALITLGWHAWLFVLFLMGLVRLLWAVYPGKAHLATSWVKEVIGTFTQRILYGIAMSAMIWMIATVFQLSLNSGLKILWSIIVLIGAFMAIRKIQTMAAGDSPNLARVGIGAAAVPAAAGGYVGMKAAGAASREVGRAGVRATGKAVRTAGRAGKFAGVESARAGGKLGMAAVSKPTQAVYNRIGQAGLEGNEKADKFIQKTQAMSRAGNDRMASVKVGAAKAQRAAGNIKDRWDMPVRHQMGGKVRKEAQDRRMAQFNDSRTRHRQQAAENNRIHDEGMDLYNKMRPEATDRKQAQRSAQQAQRDAKREAREQFRKGKAQRAADRSKRNGPGGGGKQ